MERDETQPNERAAEGEGFSRRGVLTGALLGATAMMLVACQGGGDDEEDEDD